MIKLYLLIFIMMFTGHNVFSENSDLSVASIQLVQGRASLTRGTTAKVLAARIGMVLRTGDSIHSYEESLVEIKFDNGEIVRLDENTTFVIEQANSQKAGASLPVGRVWVNMKKITSHRAFDVSTPTAVAAIRGTIYAMQAGIDHSVDLGVYDGKVDIGPSEKLKMDLYTAKQKKAPGSDPVEIQGPVEVQGPHEVTLEQWHTIVAGMKIKIAPEGAFKTSKLEKIETDTFITKNISFDRDIR